MFSELDSCSYSITWGESPRRPSLQGLDICWHKTASKLFSSKLSPKKKSRCISILYACILIIYLSCLAIFVVYWTVISKIVHIHTQKISVFYFWITCRPYVLCSCKALKRRHALHIHLSTLYPLNWLFLCKDQKMQWWKISVEFLC